MGERRVKHGRSATALQSPRSRRNRNLSGLMYQRKALADQLLFEGLHVLLQPLT